MSSNLNEFKPKSWGADPLDLAKEYATWDKTETAEETPLDKPDGISTSMVRRGVLDPKNGSYGGNSKQGCILLANVSGFSPRGKQNYEQIFGHA